MGWKMGWKHHQRVDLPPPPSPPPPIKRGPQVCRGLFRVHLLILYFEFQFSKSIKSSTFHIFLNLKYPVSKSISFPNCTKKNYPKIYTKPQTAVNEISIGIWHCLKRDRDKAVLGDVKTAFTCTPP